MGTLRYWLGWERAPSLGRLPLALLRAAVSGLLLGVPIGFVILLVIAPRNLSTALNPVWWLIMMAIGNIFAVSFYVTCALPQSYLTNLAADWPPNRLRIARALLGAVGGMAGLILAASGLRLLPIRIVNIDRMDQFIAIDAVAGAVLALIMGAWIQRDIREKQLQAAAAQAQAQALQAQIQPHFFFNTMNTVQSLIDSDAAEAKRVVGRLSGMFRYSLAAGQTGTVPIAEELAFVRDYLEIEKVRFGHRLRFQLPVEVRGLRIPSLSLQPLVENAVRHGIARRMEGGEVTVTISREGDSHLVQVRNDCEDMPRLDEFPPGHALDNIRRRLHLLYETRASLTVQAQNGKVEAMMRIPCES